MNKKATDKQSTEEATHPWFFPEHSLTIHAATYAEALAQLNKDKSGEKEEDGDGK
ncbi:hypothetical protein [Streptomyces sp. NPDC056401]|uniref:hypothetical protein n=1 Tax=Streptomyces sp. NPDC056401 TaxID=3345809 RepID=UPI0035E13490